MAVGDSCSVHHRLKSCALCFFLCLVFGTHFHECEKHGHGEVHTPDTPPYQSYEPPTSAADLMRVSTQSGAYDNRNQSPIQSTDFFLRKLFDKYGENGRISFEAFEHLLLNLGLGNIEINHGMKDHFVEGKFQEIHDPNHEHQPKLSSFNDQHSKPHRNHSDDLDRNDSHGHEDHDSHNHESHEDHDSHNHEDHDSHNHESHGDHDSHNHESHEDHDSHNHESHKDHDLHNHESHEDHDSHNHEDHDSHNHESHEDHDSHNHESHGHGFESDSHDDHDSALDSNKLDYDTLDDHDDEHDSHNHGSHGDHDDEHDSHIHDTDHDLHEDEIDPNDFNIESDGSAHNGESQMGRTEESNVDIKDTNRQEESEKIKDHAEEKDDYDIHSNDDNSHNDTKSVIIGNLRDDDRDLDHHGDSNMEYVRMKNTSQGEFYVYRQRGKVSKPRIPYDDYESPTESYHISITTRKEKIQQRRDRQESEDTVEGETETVENNTAVASETISNFQSRKLSSVKPAMITTTESSFDVAKDRNQRELLHQEFLVNVQRHNLRHQRLRKRQRKQRRLQGWQMGDLAPSSGRRASERDEGASKIHRSKRHADNPHQTSDQQKSCLSIPDMVASLQTVWGMDISKGVTAQQFVQACPLLIYQLDLGTCKTPTDHHHGDDHQNAKHHKHTHQVESLDSDHHQHDHDNHHDDHSNHTHDHEVTAGYRDSDKIPFKVWMYALLSVTVISLVGLLGVAVVPIMQKVFYNHLLQFLVALAIGSLIGDALLHLLPHSMMASEESHDHSDGNHDDSTHAGHGHSKEGIWRGLVALGGVYFFFLTERIMAIITEWRRNINKKKRKLNSPKLYRSYNEQENEIGEKLSRHRDTVTSCEEIMMMVHPSKDLRMMAEDMHVEMEQNCEAAEERVSRSNGNSHTAKISDGASHSHGHRHGHSHGHHGHSHEVPQSVASVAWMVIMGDGLHNFSDGLAIGAAFANSISGGVSTSVAVFCHELPHELGDFAVLLRAGMSVRQALVYNCLSSVLCLFGMVVGVCAGNIGSVSLWIFALAGGMFIYIALVDMLPEITAVNPKAGENPVVHLMLQSVGMMIGAGIMLLIALYEEDIKLPHFEP